MDSRRAKRKTLEGADEGKPFIDCKRSDLELKAVVEENVGRLLNNALDLHNVIDSSEDYFMGLFNEMKERQSKLFANSLSLFEEFENINDILYVKNSRIVGQSSNPRKYSTPGHGDFPRYLMDAQTSMDHYTKHFAVKMNSLNDEMKHFSESMNKMQANSMERAKMMRKERAKLDLKLFSFRSKIIGED